MKKAQDDKSPGSDKEFKCPAKGNKVTQDNQEQVLLGVKARRLTGHKESNDPWNQISNHSACTHHDAARLFDLAGLKCTN